MLPDANRISVTTGRSSGWPRSMDEMRELVLDAWQMVVPKKVALAYDELSP